MRIKAHIVGGKELEHVLRQLPKELVSQGRGAKNPVFKSLDAAAEPVLSSAQNLAPYDTGRLRGAIKKRRHPNPRYLNEIVGVGVDLGNSRDDPNGAWYGFIVEHHTGWLRRSMEKNREKSTNIYRRELGGRLKRIAGKLGRKNLQAIAARASR